MNAKEKALKFYYSPLSTLLIGVVCIAIIYHLKGQYDKGYKDGYNECIEDVKRIVANIDARNNAQVFNPYSK